jgi:mannosyltransferase
MAPVVALCGFLLYRLAPDVGEKPLYEDEAVAGLIAMRPLGEVLETVILDRGGAPLHFVLAHAVFWVDASADALRWLSVLAALAAVPLCFDLARRLDGPGAGVVAAAVAASSTALAVYGSFGRMYALFVLAAALFADLFVRALQQRTSGAVAAAAAAGWLLPAVHPYGAIPAFVALVGAAAIWRGRSARAAWPVLVAVLAAVPFVVADLRLADRAALGGGDRSLASPAEAWDELVAAISSFAGGDGLPLLFFTALALGGLAVLVRRRPAFAAVAASIALPPLLFVVLRTESAPDLSPRHLFYGLPFWAAAVGVGAATLMRRNVALALVALIAVTSPASALRDPRELGFGSVDPDRAPAVRADADELLLPYSAVFLARLSDVRDALAVPHGPGEEIVATLEHADEPIGAVLLAVPTRPWTVVRVEGPFDRSGAVAAVAQRVQDDYGRRSELHEWVQWLQPGLCEALRELGRACP